MGIALVSLTTSGKKHRSALARVSVVVVASLAAIASPIVVFQRSPQAVQLSLYDGRPAEYRDGAESASSVPEPSSQPAVGVIVPSTDVPASTAPTTATVATPATDGTPTDGAATSSPGADGEQDGEDAEDGAAPAATDAAEAELAPQEEPAQELPAADMTPPVVLPPPPEAGGLASPTPSGNTPSSAASGAPASSNGKASAATSKSPASPPTKHASTTNGAAPGGQADASVVVLPAANGSIKPVEQRIDTTLGTLVVRIEPAKLTLVKSKPAAGWSFDAHQPVPQKVIVRCTSWRSTHEITLSLGADGKTTVQWTAGAGSNRSG